MVITTPDGELCGIRVMWRIKYEFLQCQFTLTIELNDNEIGRDISDNLLTQQNLTMSSLTATDNTGQECEEVVRNTEL